MPRIVDTVANAGKREIFDYTFLGTASTMDGFILKIQEMLQNQGWDLVASTTTSGHPDRTLRSMQSPWHNDLVAPPSTYKGKIRLRFFATNNTILRVRVANDDASVSNAAGDIQAVTNNGTFRINANPYGISWRNVIAGASISFLAQAPHTPRWLQEAGLVDFIYAHASGAYGSGMYFNGGHAFVHINSDPISQTFDDVGSGFGSGAAPRIKCVSGYGGGPFLIANPIDDPTLVTPSLWFPWFLPAEIGLPKNWADAQRTWYCGWFWDMLYSTDDPTGKGNMQEMSFDNGQKYYSITTSNSAGSTAAGTLWARMP